MENSKAGRATTLRVGKDKDRSKGTSKIPWTFPKNTLEDALGIAKAIEAQNAGNPMKADLLV